MLSNTKYSLIKTLSDAGISANEIAQKTGKSLGAVYYHIRCHKNKTADHDASEESCVTDSKVISGKLMPFIEDLNKNIKAGIINSRKLYSEFKEKGYQGSYGLLNTYVREYISQHDRKFKRSIRIETGPGEQAQVDWGTFGRVLVNGKPETLHAFVYVLSYSRAMYVEFVTNQRQQTFHNCHIHAFEKLGVPKAIRYDNVKTVIISREKLGDGSLKFYLNSAFQDFALYYGFTPELCPPYWPRSKGKVEAGIKYLRYNFMLGIKLPKRLTSLQELNDKVAEWVGNVANQRIHSTTLEKPSILWEKEKEFLNFPNGLPSFNTMAGQVCRGSKNAEIVFKYNFYSIPEEFRGKALYARETNNQGIQLLEIYRKGKLIARHNMAKGRGEHVVDNNHILQKLKRKRGRPSLKKIIKGETDYILVTRRDLKYYNNLILN